MDLRALEALNELQETVARLVRRLSFLVSDDNEVQRTPLDPELLAQFDLVRASLVSHQTEVKGDAAPAPKRMRSETAQPVHSDAWWTEELTVEVPKSMTNDALFNLLLDALWRCESVGLKFEDGTECGVFLNNGSAHFTLEAEKKVVPLKGKDEFPRRLINLLANPRVRTVEIGNNQGEDRYVTERLETGDWTVIFAARPDAGEA